MYSGIYTITNTIDGKIYVGYTKHLSQRRFEHMSKLSKGNHTSTHLQYAVNQYGVENFIYETLEECPRHLLVAMEHYWCNILDTHNPKRGYNILPTHPEGENKRLSEETKQKIRIARAKQVITEEHKQAISKASKGRPRKKGVKLSQEHKNKVSKSLLEFAKNGGYNNPERSRKISESKKGKKFGPEYSEACRLRRLGTKLSDTWKNNITIKSREKYYKPFDTFTKDGVFYRTYTHIVDMVRDLKLHDNACQTIGRVLKGNGKSAYGFTFKYKEV